MKKNELLAFIITFIFVLISVILLSIILSQQARGQQILFNPDDQPLSAIDNVDELGLYTCGIADNYVASLFGKYTLGRVHLLSLAVTHKLYSYELYDETSQKVGSQQEGVYGYILGYRYQFWDVDAPFLGFAVKGKYEKEALTFDTDVTIYGIKSKTLFLPAITLGVENAPVLPRYYLIFSEEILTPINFLLCLKCSLLSVEDETTWQAGFFVAVSIKEFKRFSKLELRVDSDFSPVGYLRTNVGVVLSFRDLIRPRVDLEVGTKYRSHVYLGSNGEFYIKAQRKRYTPEVENLIRELRDLQEVVSRIKNFTLGQSMVETARSLVQQGAYDQAREVIDKLRLYLKEW
jgi:hypothetical protein